MKFSVFAIALAAATSSRYMVAATAAVSCTRKNMKKGSSPSVSSPTSSPNGTSKSFQKQFIRKIRFKFIMTRSLTRPKFLPLLFFQTQPVTHSLRQNQWHGL